MHSDKKKSVSDIESYDVNDYLNSPNYLNSPAGIGAGTGTVSTIYGMPVITTTGSPVGGSGGTYIGHLPGSVKGHQAIWQFNEEENDGTRKDMRASDDVNPALAEMINKF